MDETGDKEKDDIRIDDADGDAYILGALLREWKIEDTALVGLAVGLAEGNDVRTFELECPKMTVTEGPDVILPERVEIEELAGFEFEWPEMRDTEET